MWKFTLSICDTLKKFWAVLEILLMSVLNIQILLNNYLRFQSQRPARVMEHVSQVDVDFTTSRREDWGEFGVEFGRISECE